MPVTDDADQPYNADSSLFGKIRRRAVRLMHRRNARLDIARPTITFTFDDIPLSAADVGADILEQHDARGVFYVCAGLFGSDGHMGTYADAESVSNLARRGHEVACHTYSHLDCGSFDAAAIQQDADRNVAALRQLGADARHFAYPYGEVAPHAKAALSNRYGSLRAVHAGLVSSGSDLNQLPAVGIEGVDAEAVSNRWMDMAKARRAWLILYTHDVRDEASPYGCSPAILERLVSRARREGFDIRTMSEVLG